MAVVVDRSLVVASGPDTQDRPMNRRGRNFRSRIPCLCARALLQSAFPLLIFFLSPSLALFIIYIQYNLGESCRNLHCFFFPFIHQSVLKYTDNFKFHYSSPRDWSQTRFPSTWTIFGILSNYFWLERSSIIHLDLTSQIVKDVIHSLNHFFFFMMSLALPTIFGSASITMAQILCQCSMPRIKNGT